MNVFTKKDVGCYADQANGEDHRRYVLAYLVNSCNGIYAACDRQNAILNDLAKEPSDDYSEEEDAIEYLNEFTEDGIFWVQDGDLFLREESEEE